MCSARNKAFNIAYFLNAVMLITESPTLNRFTFTKIISLFEMCFIEVEKILNLY